MSGNQQMALSKTVSTPVCINTYSGRDYDTIELVRETVQPTASYYVNLTPLFVLLLLSIAAVGLLAGPFAGTITIGISRDGGLRMSLATMDNGGAGEQGASSTAGERLEKTGFVFPDIDKRALSEADLEELRSDAQYTELELLGFAINAVYAKHGLNYGKSNRYHRFFSQWSWYQPDCTSEETVYSRFNKQETENIALLAIERDGLK